MHKCNYFYLNSQIIRRFSAEKSPPPKNLHIKYQRVTILRIERPLLCVRSNLYNDRCFPIAHNDHNQPVLRRHPRHCIRRSGGTEEPRAPFNRHSSVFRLRNRQGAFPGTDTQAVVSPGTASRSSHPRFTGRHGTRMSPATVGTGIFPPQNSVSAHGEDAFACCLLLRHKNETIPHITDMQDHCFMLRNLTQQKRPSEKDLVSGKRDSDPRPQPWQGCALPTELFPQSANNQQFTSIEIAVLPLDGDPMESIFTSCK